MTVTFQNGLTTLPRITDVYGWRIHPIYGDRRMHFGTDTVGHPDGMNHTPKAGVVIFAQYNGGAGNEVRVQTPDGTVFRLKHHAAMIVKVGDQLPAGAATGPTGTTGDSTGVHCHLELWAGTAYTIDPMPALIAEVESYLASLAQPNGKKKPMRIVSAPWLPAQNTLPGLPKIGDYISGVSDPNEAGGKYLLVNEVSGRSAQIRGTQNQIGLLGKFLNENGTATNPQAEINWIMSQLAAVAPVGGSGSPVDVAALVAAIDKSDDDEHAELLAAIKSNPEAARALFTKALSSV